MDVYEYDKSLLVRLKEIESVLCNKDSCVPASQVRKEWSHYIKNTIEQGGRLAKILSLSGHLL
jgi:hypothetical protein